MDPGPLRSLLLLAGLLLHRRGCDGVPSLYTIDEVGLSILPGPAVPSGTAVTLRCTVSVSHDPGLRLTHLFRITRYDVLLHAVNTSATRAEYRLDPARAADSGSYECQVAVKDKVRSSVDQMLTVTGLQTPDLHLNASSLYESEELTATCSAPQEKGALAFTFFQRSERGAVSPIKQAFSTGNWSKTKLVLRDTGAWEVFCTYSISMLPQAGTSNSSNVLKVQVKGLFIVPVMNVLPSTSVFEGDVVEVVCKVVNPPGSVNVYLTRNSTVLKQGLVGLNHRLTVLLADAGEYVCKAEYGATQKETYETIRVKELFSRPTLRLEPEDVFVGEIMRVSCVVDSYSPQRVSMEDVRFSVYRDGVLLAPEHSYSAVAQDAQNGNYSCRAQTHTQSSALAKESPVLVVSAKVPVSRPVLSVVGGKLVLGRPFVLRCHSDSGSLPITYTLHGPARPPQTREILQPGDPDSFNTSAIQRRADILTFLCQARNQENSAPATSLGQDLLQSTQIIEPVSQPALTLDPNGPSISEGQQLTLLCSVQKGTLPVTFTWYHTERAEPLGFQTPLGPQGSYVIPGVAGAHSGGYFCEGSNAAGVVKRSFTVVVGVKMAGWKKGVVAVACVLLLTAIVLAVLHKKGLLRGGRAKQLSVRPASTHTERLSLTKAVESAAVNDTDEQISVGSPEEAAPCYTEVQTGQPDPSRGPLKKGTDTVYSEVRHSKQGVSEEPADGGSVEYAQLNNDSDGGHRTSGGVQPDSVDDIDELNNTGAAAPAPEHCTPDPPSPDS